MELRSYKDMPSDVNHTGGNHTGGPHKQMIFAPDDNGHWQLRWKWVLNTSEPGYLLVSEHIALGLDHHYLYEWPFVDSKYDLPSWDDQGFYRDGHNRHFERRMNNKSCKERRKARRKQKHKVPGAWI
jgi:hypothetical protein